MKFGWWKREPKIWGDGIHDDTKALQFYIDHGKNVSFSNCTFSISGSIVFSGTLTMTGCSIVGLNVRVPLFQWLSEARRDTTLSILRRRLRAYKLTLSHMRDDVMLYLSQIRSRIDRRR